MANLLVIDDDPEICETLTNYGRYMGHDVRCAFDLKEGLGRIHQDPFDVVFLDVQLPDGDGLKAIPEIRAIPSAPEIVIITGQGNPDGAELAIKSGSWDYIQKPLSIEAITLTLHRVLQYRSAKTSRKPPVVLNRDGIIGSSPEIMESLGMLAQASCSDAGVLITGETGTGKELFALAIHNNSKRSGNAFVVVDCTALPETLIESTLFGHEKGAFTGAQNHKDGLVKMADGGTLFLDEVGELPLVIQKKFLRVLQEHRFRPVGSHQEIKSDFRLIAATHRNLDQLVQENIFRQDLLFRLRSFSIELPSLRERKKDIIELSKYHIEKLCYHYGIEIKGLADDFLEAISTYDWPGNVRELFNALEGAVTSARNEPVLYSYSLPIDVRAQIARSSVVSNIAEKGHTENGDNLSAPLPGLKDFKESMEKQYLKDLIALTHRNVKKACRICGLSQSRFYGLLKKHNLSIPRS